MYHSSARIVLIACYAVFCIRIRNFGFIKQINVGTRKIAPSIFKNSRIASSTPISAWNFRAENIHSRSPMVRVVET